MIANNQLMAAIDRVEANICSDIKTVRSDLAQISSDIRQRCSSCKLQQFQKLTISDSDNSFADNSYCGQAGVTAELTCRMSMADTREVFMRGGWNDNSMDEVHNVSWHEKLNESLVTRPRLWRVVSLYIFESL